MEKSVLFLLFIQISLIVLNAIFSCAEIAIISLNDNKLAIMERDGDKRAIRLVKLISKPARFFATIQVAITLSGFFGSAFAAENFSDKMVNLFTKMGVSLPARTLNTVSVILITILISYLTLVLGELVPKRVGMRKADTLALALASFISVVEKAFSPVVWFLTISTNFVLRLLGIDPIAPDDVVSEEEIRMMVDIGSEKGVIDKEEKEFIHNVFEFDDISADQIATHRTEIILLWLSDSIGQWEKTIQDSRHSIFPVCSKTVDNVIGILDTNEYFRLANKSRENVLQQAIKPAYFVPSAIKADVLFENMKRTRNNFAIVLDDQNSVIGIVTMNDLIEQLIGEFND